MKKTQRKDAIRNIRKRIVSYLSLCLVVMLGLGGVLTTRYVAAGLIKQGAEYYNAHNFKDFELVSSLGISEANLEKIAEADGVTDAEGVMLVDGSVLFDGKKRPASIISMTEKVSVPELTEGALPEGRDECMIGEDFAEVEGLKVGDRIRIALAGLEALKDPNEGLEDSALTDAEESSGTVSGSDDEAAEEASQNGEASASPALFSEEFTITGLMKHPDYMRRKSVNTVSLPMSAFNEKVTNGLYTRAFVSIDEPEAGAFGEGYLEETAGKRRELEKLAEELEKDRINEVKKEAYAYIDEQWAEAERKLAEAEAEIRASEAQLNKKLAKGRNQLNSSEGKLAKELRKSKKKLQKGKLSIEAYEKELKAAKAELKKKKEALQKARELFNNQAAWMEAPLKKIKKVLEDFNEILKKEGISDSEEYKAAEQALAAALIDHKEDLEKLMDFARSKEAREACQQTEKQTGVKLVEYLDLIAKVEVDAIIKEAEAVLSGEGHFSEDTLKAIDTLLAAIQSAKEQLAEAEAAIASAESEIAGAEKLLKEKQAEYKAGKKKLAAETAKAEKKINAGWSKYYSEKGKYEGKLAEAVALLATDRDKAEEKLAEAKASAGDVSCEWIVLDRKSNAGYVDLQSNLNALKADGEVFGLLFTIVTAIVCMSTLIIIIDEQKKLVGTSKAFGFRRREVLGKYLSFGVSAAITGSILAVIAAYVLAEFVQRLFTRYGMYQMETAKSIVMLKPTLLFAILIISVTAAAAIAACREILKSPASVLMSGTTAARNKKRKKSSNKGTLYSRLILRNIMDDKARVTVTISIIGLSCMLIGVGITMKLSYDNMAELQINEVNRYDLHMDLNEEVSEEDRGRLLAVLKDSGVRYLEAAREDLLYRWDDRLDGATVICADPERLGDFYAVNDPETGSAMILPEDGILIPRRMNESYGMKAGDRLTVLGRDLSEHEVLIKGTYVNYVGRTFVMSPAAYRSAFGEERRINCFYINLNGADKAALEKQLLEVTDEISFVYADAFVKRFEASSRLYNILVFIMTGVAILISFMILTNLSNICLIRKRTELSIMRVNGFSIRQARNYLSQEAWFTTTAGLTLAVLLGAVITPAVITVTQQPDLEFDKSFQLIAWVIAVGLEGLFSAGINKYVFRKVKDLDLRDIQ